MWWLWVFAAMTLVVAVFACVRAMEESNRAGALHKDLVRRLQQIAAFQGQVADLNNTIQRQKQNIEHYRKSLSIARGQVTKLKRQIGVR